MKTRAQSTVEFTFAVIVIVFLIYGMVRIFRWVGMDLAGRRMAQDETLIYPSWPNADYSTNPNQFDPNAQTNPNFYRVQSMDAIYNGMITNGSTPL